MLGVDASWTPGIVMLTDAVKVVCTSLGGFRAVIITDLIQTILLFGGALLVLAVVTARTGGWDWLPTWWQEHRGHLPLCSFDPSTRLTVVGTIMSTLLFMVCTSGGDPISLQWIAPVSLMVNIAVGLRVLTLIRLRTTQASSRELNV
jgi:SSS family solute:Na+ symporter